MPDFIPLPMAWLRPRPGPSVCWLYRVLHFVSKQKTSSVRVSWFILEVLGPGIYRTSLVPKAWNDGCIVPLCSARVLLSYSDFFTLIKTVNPLFMGKVSLTVHDLPSGCHSRKSIMALHSPRLQSISSVSGNSSS